MGLKPRASSRRHRQEPDPFAQEIGARIRQLRNEQNFSFDAFVGVTGLGRGYVSELERGLAVPTVNTLARIAAAFSVTVADLVLGDSLREELFAETLGLPQHDILALLEEAQRRRDQSGGS